jgi:hypothetical protein
MAKSSLFAWALRASYARPTTGTPKAALARSAAMQLRAAENLMNSRRSMGFPRTEGHAGQVNNITFLARVPCREPCPVRLLMSALGQKQTFLHFLIMSALPPKADIG